MAEARGVLTYTITIVTVLISLIAPVPILAEYRLIIVATLLLVFISIILSDFQKIMIEQEKELAKLKEKLKIHEQLIDIKKDIELLKEKRLK